MSETLFGASARVFRSRRSGRAAVMGAACLFVAAKAVLAGGRMAAATRRVGLLKAVGGTPGLVTAVLMAENLALALVAAAGAMT